MNHEQQHSAEEFDRRFEAGEDVSAHVDWAGPQAQQADAAPVNVDFPTWMAEALGTEARHLGVSRQALIKVWIANCLAHDAHNAQIKFPSRREDGKSRSNPAFFISFYKK